MGTNGSGGKTSGPAPARAKPVGSSVAGTGGSDGGASVGAGKGGGGRRRGVASSAAANTDRASAAIRKVATSRRRSDVIDRPAAQPSYTVRPRRAWDSTSLRVRSTFARQPAIHVASSAARPRLEPRDRSRLAAGGRRGPADRGRRAAHHHAGGGRGAARRACGDGGGRRSRGQRPGGVSHGW